MRWPFGPPHLTLKPSKKTEKTKQKKQKTKKKQKQKQHPTTKKESKQTETKPTPTRKTKTRNTKTPKPFKPKINKNKPPHKAQKNWEKKTSIFNTLATLPDKKHNDIKAWQETNKKTPFCHVQKQPTIFHQFSVFCLHTVFVMQLLCFSENTIKIVLSDKNTAFQKHS